MDTKQAFGTALRKVRQEKGLTQEDFALISSRTYLSSLERGLYSPTVDKVTELSAVLHIHPLTLLCIALAEAEGVLPETLISRVDLDLKEMGLGQ